MPQPDYLGHTGNVLVTLMGSILGFVLGSLGGAVAITVTVLLLGGLGTQFENGAPSTPSDWLVVGATLACGIGGTYVGFRLNFDPPSASDRTPSTVTPEEFRARNPHQVGTAQHKKWQQDYDRDEQRSRRSAERHQAWLRQRAAEDGERQRVREEHPDDPPGA